MLKDCDFETVTIIDRCLGFIMPDTEFMNVPDTEFEKLINNMYKDLIKQLDLERLKNIKYFSKEV